MFQLHKHDFLLLGMICCAVLPPVFMLCGLLMESAAETGVLPPLWRSVTFAAAVPYIPFCLLLWRLSSIGTKGKLLRVMLVLVGAAGVIAPVALFQSRAYGLSGIWQLVWSGLLLWCANLIFSDRLAVVMAVSASLLGLPCIAYSFLLAISHAA